MNKMLLLSILLFTLYNCDKNDETKTVDTGIVGKWNWVRTEGGLAFHIHDTPESTGKSIQLYLNDKKEYTTIVNQKIVSSGTYDISMQKSIYSGKSEAYIRLTPDNEAQNPAVLRGNIKVTGNTTLTINDNCYDGCGSMFERIK
jgi:hypothetical protein